MFQFFVIPNDFRDPVWAPFGDLWRPFGELASQIRGARFPRGSHDSPWGGVGFNFRWIWELVLCVSNLIFDVFWVEL